MIKLIRKLICPVCEPWIEDVSRVYFGDMVVGSPLFYLRKDEAGNDEYVMLPDGEYSYKGKVLIIENEVIK